MKELTQKQRDFCEYIVNGFENKGISQLKAYRLAYNNTTMNDNSVRCEATDLMGRSDIRAYIKVLREERKERIREQFKIDDERITRGYAHVAFVDPRQCFNEDGSLIHIKDLPYEVATAIKDVEVVTKNNGEGEVLYVSKIRFDNRLKALEDLAKHIGFFEKHNEQKKENVFILPDGDSVPEWMKDVILTPMSQKLIEGD